MKWGKTLIWAILLGIILPWIISAALIPRMAPGNAITITVLKSGTAETMELERYLSGVLQAEMPVSFSLDALKAQAVAARTYTILSLQTGRKHGKGIICTAPDCCQDFRDGTPDPKICRAVEETAGLILTFEGAPIEATYFSCSGGRTEAAEDVWGRGYPYLISVDSPGEERASYFQEVVLIPREKILTALSLPSNADLTPGEVARTSGGGVERISLGGKVFSGLELRKKLLLNSTNFTVSETPEGLLFQTMGFGHRVGLSQYGAEAMAAQGADFKKILAHYYPGALCQPISEIFEE